MTSQRLLSVRGGETSCRGSPSSAFIASSFQGRENSLSPSLPAPYSTYPGPNLTFSHFVPGAGHGRRGGSITPGDVEVSQRKGRSSLENVTMRETKRPSERPRDREYQRRFSLGVSHPNAPPSAPLGGHAWPREDYFSPPARSLVAVEVGSPLVSHGQDHGNNRGGGNTQSGRNANQLYHIRLICSGESVQHVVCPSMAISDLIVDAGQIFGLDPSGITLVLFSTVPEVLQKESTIQGPPFVAPNSSVMVFSLSHQPLATPHRYGPRTPQTQVEVGHGAYHYTAPPVGPYVNSKLLSTFKLPKFDGVSKNWKTWDRAFQRFLGLHQLDHVLESGFLSTVWNVPGAKEANKMVYFLLEDAVAVGSLASKFIRQAVKWNGHEAYIFLHDGYVFSGPQSATILLSQLSNLRLKRDENPSLFCMRLVELVEDLEAIPGDSAVYLTEQQKLGYLLSAIRHESGLQSVYSQLQSEQLRGTVTFDQACRELHFRCEAIRADEFLDSHPGGKALVAMGSEKPADLCLLSTELKKKGQDGQPKAKLE